MKDSRLDGLLKALTTGDDEGREAAALALGRLGPTAYAPLIELLADGDPQVRWWAARTLAEVGGELVVPPLIGALADPDTDVRACACLALGRVGDGSATPALAARLADESTLVASIAADALHMIGPAAVQPLAEMVNHPDARVRLMAVRALGRIRDQGAVVPLFAASEDSSYLVRYYAQEGLEALGVGMVFFAPK